MIGSLFSGIGGLEGRKTYAPALVDGVRRLYATGLTQGEVARALGITQKVVWRLMRRHGLRARVAAKRDQRGERNHMWKGAGAGYQAMHQRVAVVRGTPSHCEKCGTTRSKRFEWASLSRRYDDPFDYVRLCCSCHHVLDGHVRNLGAHAEGKAVSP